MNLIPAINSISIAIHRLVEKGEDVDIVKQLQIALKIVKEANTACLRCDGNGFIFIGKKETMICGKCKGSGIDPKITFSVRRNEK